MYNKKYKDQARSRKERQDFSFLYKYILMSFLIITLVMGGFFIYPYITKHTSNIKLFNISSIEVKGNEILSYEEIIKNSGIILSKTSIFTNKDTIITNIKKNNLVYDANILKKYPDKIIIHIQENKPVALINLDALYYINEKGRIYSKFNADDNINLPILTGIKKEEILSNTLPEYAITAIDFLKYSSKGIRILGMNNISEINCKDNKYFTIYTNDNGIPIQMKITNLKNDFSRLESVLNHLYRSGLYEKTKKIVINTDKKLYYASFGE
jgi:cell division protein FtsQ